MSDPVTLDRVYFLRVALNQDVPLPAEPLMLLGWSPEDAHAMAELSKTHAGCQQLLGFFESLGFDSPPANAEERR